jgi:hypothetical protein
MKPTAARCTRLIELLATSVGPLLTLDMSGGDVVFSTDQRAFE